MNELYHHGVKGMKWGVRRTKEQLGYSDSSPKIKTKNGDYIYKKGTVIGRFGSQKIDDNIMFAYTNKKDRSYYSNHFGGEEQIMICKKDIKMPSLSKQFLELYKYTGDKRCINDPYEYWKDHINVIGPMADGYFNYMKKQGYDAVIDFRNYGLTEDPIMILNPKQCLQNQKDNLEHSGDDMNELYHHGVKGQKWGVRRYQNKDGSLTTAGRQHKLKNSKYYTIPKGTKMFRAVSNGSSKFMDRDYAYVNITDHYYEHSYNTSSGFDGRFDSDYVLKSTKSLKIASTEEYFNALCETNNINIKQALSKIPKDVNNKGRYYIQNIADHKLVEGEGGNYKALNDVVEHLRKRGYDGVVDPIDGSHQLNKGESPMSTILFDPKNNLEIVDKYDLY